MRQRIFANACGGQRDLGWLGGARHDGRSFQALCLRIARSFQMRVRTQGSVVCLCGGRSAGRLHRVGLNKFLKPCMRESISSQSSTEPSVQTSDSHGPEMRMMKCRGCASGASGHARRMTTGMAKMPTRLVRAFSACAMLRGGRVFCFMGAGQFAQGQSQEMTASNP